jgi:pyruvate dehydrogenase E2 component (dihydrolipoamide acetyltransferase)
MAVEVILPKVDMDMSTGVISQWHVKDGDTVKKGQPIFDIETDKAAMEIEAPGDGTIKLADLGGAKDIAIGTVVAVIYGAGEAVKSVGLAVPISAPAATPIATQTAATLPSPVASRQGAVGDDIRATPLARRLARQAGLHLGDIIGSGPNGRIVAADVQSSRAAPVKAPSPAAENVADAGIRAQFEAGSFTEIPLDGMRRTIAQRLTLSKQTVPHFYLTATCTIDTLIAIRQRLNEHASHNPDKSPVWKLSINDFIIKAMALALQQVPAANVTFADNAILQHHRSDIGVAVAVEGGLFTPVIRAAESKTLSIISMEMKELAARARARKLQPAEYQGGSAAISNLGMFGVEQFSAIINPPQATILAVGAAIERFIPVNGQPVLATQVMLTLSCDHRAVDGAVGAALLQSVKQLIEDPALMLA